MKKKILAIFFIVIELNADIVMCKGASSIEVINGIVQEKKDISNLNFQLNTTDEIAVMIFDKEVTKFKYIKSIQHPSGFNLDAYNDGVSQEMLYAKKMKVATYKTYEIKNDKQVEYIATFECKNKEYK